MTLDCVTLIAILFKLHQWSILLRTSESVELKWRYGWVICKNISYGFWETKWHIIYVNQKHVGLKTDPWGYTWDNITRVWAYTWNIGLLSSVTKVWWKPLNCWGMKTICFLFLLWHIMVYKIKSFLQIKQ